MKKIFLSLITILSIFIFSFSAFATANDGFEELASEVSNGVYNGIYFTSAKAMIGFSESSKWKQIDSNIEYNCDIMDAFDYFINTNASATQPIWIEYGKNEWSLVTKTEKVTYTDENDKTKTLNGWYAISEIIEDGVVVIDNKAYYFEEGVCANNGGAITSNKGVVTFKGKNVDKNFEVEIDIEQCDLDVYESDDFDGTKGVFDKDSNKKLYNGYWILDKGNEKYDLYQANNSGSSSTVSGATNKSAYDLYTIINDKGYTKKSTTEPPSSNNTTTNNSNTTTNTNTTSNKNITKNTNNGLWASEGLNKNDYSVKVVNGSLQLILNNGYKFIKEGTYYVGDDTLLTIDANGKQTAWKDGNKGNYTDISQLKTYCIIIGEETTYWVTK